MSNLKGFTAPEHVPPELVHPYPAMDTATTLRDPFGDLAIKIRDDSPDIFYAPLGAFGVEATWVVWRAEDVRTIYSDTEHFSKRGNSPFSKLSGGTWHQIPSETDSSEHAMFRALLNPVFAPKAMEKLSEKIRHYARDYILKFKDTGECEFMKDFAYKFPIKVFLELMGLPEERTHEFLQWEMDLIYAADQKDVATAVRSVVSYLQEEIADRRENPGDDMLSYIVHAEAEGRSLTEDEIIGLSFNLFIGGLDTVSTHLGLGFEHLAKHPEDQAKLRAEPALIPNAINEMMRAYPGVSIFRTCAKEYTIKGVTFRPGDKILLSNTVAGRDPAEFDQPDEVRFDRRTRNLSFGFGAHICLGIHLARREMRIAMEEFLSLVPPFHLPEGYNVEHRLTIIQPVELPLRW